MNYIPKKLHLSTHEFYRLNCLISPAIANTSTDFTSLSGSKTVVGFSSNFPDLPRFARQCRDMRSVTDCCRDI